MKCVTETTFTKFKHQPKWLIFGFCNIIGQIRDWSILNKTEQYMLNINIPQHTYDINYVHLVNYSIIRQDVSLV